MKKLIITILAMATMALAATKPVCKETYFDGWRYRFDCERPTDSVKEINIILIPDYPSYMVTKYLKDGSRVSSDVFFDKDDNHTHVIETTFDDLGVLVHKDKRKIYGNQFFILYRQLRDEYDLRRKN